MVSMALFLHGPANSQAPSRRHNYPTSIGWSHRYCDQNDAKKIKSGARGEEHTMELEAYLDKQRPACSGQLIIEYHISGAKEAVVA
jgi:hypothetical protein